MKESVASLQLERDNLNKKLKSTIEQNSVTEELRDENAKLHQLLDNSLSLNEKLQSSTTDSFDSSLHTSIKLSPITNFQTPPPPSTTALPLSSPPSIQFSSPTAEIIHLRQELTKAHQTCLKLERQQAQDATEMAKIQGSLQALVKIQEHLGKENKSLTQTFVNLEEEKEVYKQETERLNNELVTSQDNLKALSLEVDDTLRTVIAQLQEMSTQNHFNNIQGINKILDSKGDERLELIPKVIECLSSLFHESLSNGNENGLKEEITLLQERVSKACNQLQVMEDELDTKERELEAKDRELVALRVEGERQINVESFKKDLETQYQV